MDGGHSGPYGLSTQLVEVNPATPALNGLRVVECIDDEEEGVLHVIQGKAPDVGTPCQRPSRLAAQIGSPCTRDSTFFAVIRQTLLRRQLAAFECWRNLVRDVDFDTPTQEVIERAVELANNVIWENRMITISRVT